MGQEPRLFQPHPSTSKRTSRKRGRPTPPSPAGYAWAWTGDVESTWEGLRTTLRALLGLSLSGVY
ncbi:hypothetical protein CSW24_00665, partial [Thermus scotoductus]